MALATLSIDLIAKTAALQEGLDKAARDAEKSANQIAQGFDSVKSAAMGLGAVLAGALAGFSFVNLVKSSIDAQDHLNDLAKSTQLTVEQIGGIGFAASQAGGDLDSAAASMGKLNLSIAKAAAGDKEASALFDTIGISATDASGKARDAGSVLVDVANKFASYADGPEKAAIGNALFGKSYQGIIPLLADGGDELQKNIDYFARFSGVSAESAKAADAFNDEMGKLHLLSSQFGSTLANALLPTLQAIVEAIVHAKEQGSALQPVVDGIRVVFETIAITGANVAFVLQGVGREIGAIAAQGGALARMDIKGFHAISEAVKEDGVRARAELDKFEQRILSRGVDPFAGLDHPHSGDGGIKPAAPSLPKVGNGTKERESDIDRLIAKLRQQEFAEITAGNATTELEKIQIEFASNPKFANATNAQRQAALDYAKAIDELKDKTLEYVEISEKTLFTRSEKGAFQAGDFRETNKNLDDMIEKSRTFRAIMASTTTGKTEELVRQEGILRETLGDSAENAVKLKEGIEALYGTAAPQFEQMSEFAKQASANIQDALGDTLKDTLTGNFNDIGKRWGNLLIDMAAQATAAQIGEALFGKSVGGVQTGGLFSSLFSSVLGPPKAAGGTIQPYGLSRINEHGPETLEVQGKTYLANGGSPTRVYPAGGSGGSAPIVNNWNIAAGVSRVELAQLVPVIEQRIKGQLRNEARRPGYQGA